MCSRLFRCLICMLLVVALIVQVSPLQAQATAITGSAVAIGVGIGLAVAVGLQALGIRQGTDGAAFSSLVADCAAALSPEWAIDGLTTMLALTTDGVTRTYASQDFLQSILDWLFDSGSLTATQEYAFPYYDDEYVIAAYQDAMSYPYHCVAYNITNGRWYFYGSDYELKYSYDSSADGYFISCLKSSCCYYELYSHGSVSSKTWSSKGSGTGTFINITDTGFANEISSVPDLTLESVGQDVDTDYETYIDESIISVDFGIQFEDDPNTGRNEEDNNKVGWVPTRLLTSTGDTYADQTQADAQTGLTDPEIVDDLLNNSGNGSGSNSGSESWTPSDISNFTLDLSEYFPFCIPFDLYDFFACLNADPVAPVIEWEIYLPGGEIYPLEIDLSPFDSVAQLLRRLQLLLFCVGLAFKTRDLIKG